MAPLAYLDPEQYGQLLPPLPDQWFGRDEQDPLGPFRQHLGEDQPGLDRLSEPDFIGQDAAAFANPRQGENHRVDLMGVGVDSTGTLGREHSAPLRGTPKPDEVLGVVAAVNRVRLHAQAKGIAQPPRLENMTRGRQQRLAWRFRGIANRAL
jgi:hypothetical protein